MALVWLSERTMNGSYRFFAIEGARGNFNKDLNYLKENLGN